VRASLPIVVGALALLTACGGGSDHIVPTQQTPTLLDVQAQVFTPRCAVSGCHVGSGAPFGLDLSSASSSEANTIGVDSNEMPSLKRIEAGDASMSYLYRKITADPTILGDPMPASGGPLSASQIALIQEWIDAGAP
jgi:hypothetical protein